MSCKFKNNEGMGMIKKFISSAHTKPIISSAHTKPTPPHRFIQGIKDFFLDLFGDTQKVMSFLGKICGEEGPPFTKQESMKNRLPAHLFELLKTHLIDPNAFSEGGCYLRGEWCSYRSAMESRNLLQALKESSSFRG